MKPRGSCMLVTARNISLLLAVCLKSILKMKVSFSQSQWRPNVFFRRKFAFLQIYDRVWQSFGQETTEHPREDDIHLEGGNPPSSKSLDSDFDTESASSASL